MGTGFLGGEGNVLSPDLTPALRAQSRPGASRTCGGAGRSQGTLFQGCAGARGTRDNQVSPQTSCFHPPALVTGEHSGPGPLVARLGGAVTAGEPGGEGALTPQVWFLSRGSPQTLHPGRPRHHGRPGEPGDHLVSGVSAGRCLPSV